MKLIKQRILESIEVKRRIMNDDELIARIDEVCQTIIDCFRSGKRVYFCGNGGSAADAQHLAAELSGRYYFDRNPLPAEALHVNSSYLTAVANDYSFDDIYARYIEGMGKEGDVLVGLSTSGNSGNIVKAAETAKNKGMRVISFTGESGGRLAAVSDFLLNIPSKDTPRIQESHITIGHIICECVESALFQRP